jgi:hypothetical protein
MNIYSGYIPSSWPSGKHEHLIINAIQASLASRQPTKNSSSLVTLFFSMERGDVTINSTRTATEFVVVAVLEVYVTVGLATARADYLSARTQVRARYYFFFALSLCFLSGR